jgi:hypothetical protein
MLVQIDDAPDNTRIILKMAAPVFIGENDVWRTVGTVLADLLA